MMLSASSFLLQRKILGLSQIIHSFLDTLFNMVTEFPSPGLIDMMSTCLDASGGNMDNMRSCLPPEGWMH